MTADEADLGGFLLTAGVLAWGAILFIAWGLIR